MCCHIEERKEHAYRINLKAKTESLKRKNSVHATFVAFSGDIIAQRTWTKPIFIDWFPMVTKIYLKMKWFKS